MATAIDICNLALSHIGKPSINDFGEATAEAREANRHYGPSRRSLLQSSDWTFARKRVALAKLAPDFEERWRYTYAQPQAMLQARRIVRPRFDPRTDPRPVPFEIRGGKVYTDIDSAHLEFTQDLETTGMFPSLFSDALAALLAFRFARALTRSTNLTREMREESRDALSRAVEADSAQDVGRYTYDADALLDRDATRPHPFWGF